MRVTIRTNSIKELQEAIKKNKDLQIDYILAYLETPEKIFKAPSLKSLQ